MVFWRKKSLLFAILIAVPVFAQEQYPYKVSRVIDGYTIELETGERVRYIGIDTPETVHPTRPIEYYGREASEANIKLVEGNSVRLEFDIQERDQYGRLLAYVFLLAEHGDIFVNAWLVQNGYAKVSTYPPNVKYVEVFKYLQGEARRNNLGLWNEEVTQPSTIQPILPFLPVTDESKSITVYRTKTGSKYHKAECRYFSRSSIPILLDIAKTKLSACSACKPPK